MQTLRRRSVTVIVWRPEAAGSHPDGDVIVPFERWERERDELARYRGRLGVRLTGADAVEALRDDLGRLALIAIEFPSFTDGRGFSQARLLREAYGFKGEIRAVGDFLPDQLAFLARCGFDSFELSNPSGVDIPRYLNGISVRFQPAADGGELIFQGSAVGVNPG